MSNTRLHELNPEANMLDVVELRTSVGDGVEVAIAVPPDNSCVCIATKSMDAEYDQLTFSVSAEKVVYIVNLLRGNVLSKLSGQQAMLCSVLERYTQTLKDKRVKSVIDSMSNSSRNVENLIHELNDDDEQWKGFLNVIQMMATICRCVLHENK